MAVNREPEYLHGIPMTDEMFEYLTGMENPYRYELIDGLVYDMTGSSPEHGTIAMNMSLLLKQQLTKGGSCQSISGSICCYSWQPVGCAGCCTYP